MKKKLLNSLLALAMFLSVMLLMDVSASAATTTEVGNYSQLATAISNFTSGDTIKLTADIEQTKSISIVSGKTLTLDLNGYALIYSGGGSCITNNGTLTITDSTPSRVHYFKVSDDSLWVLQKSFSGTANYTFDSTNGLKANGVASTDIPATGKTIAVSGGCITGTWGGFALDNNKEGASNLTLNGGNIVGNTSSDLEGGGIYTRHIFVMNGGSVIGNTGRAGGIECMENSITINGGYIAYNKSKSIGGAGILLKNNYDDITMVMTDGNIVGNTAPTSGAGIYVSRSNSYAISIEMTGGNISYNRVVSSNNAYGAGVYSDLANFKMSGGTISHNVMQKTDGSVNEYSYGGGVCTSSYNSVKLGIFEFSGGTISNNEASYGAGVFNRGSFIMTGGDITANIAANGGGGVTSSGIQYVTTVLCGGNITNNTTLNTTNALSKGGGLRIHDYNVDKCILGGSIKISDNYRGTGASAVADNIAVQGLEYVGSFFSVADGSANYSYTDIAGTTKTVPALNTTNVFGVTACNNPTLEYNVQLTPAGTKQAYFDNFTSDDSAYQLYFNNSGTTSNASDDYYELVAGKTTVTEATCVNGSVSIGGIKTYLAGSSITITPSANTYYEVDKVYYQPAGGSKVEVTKDANNKYIFTAPSVDVTVSATFKAIDYSVNVASGISNGSVSVSNSTANYGETVTITPNPNANYVIGGVYYQPEGGSLIEVFKDSNNKYTFTMPGVPVTVSASFGTAYYGTSVATDIANGTISLSSVSASVGSTVTVTPTPYYGYKLVSMKYNDGTKDVAITKTGGAYTFTMPGNPVTVSAVFAPDVSFSISLTLSSNITINLFTVGNKYYAINGSSAEIERYKLTANGVNVPLASSKIYDNTLAGSFNNFAAKDFNNKIHFVFTYDGAVIKEADYSVTDYCNAVKGQGGTLGDLCNAIILYADAADVYNEDMSTGSSTYKNTNSALSGVTVEATTPVKYKNNAVSFTMSTMSEIELSLDIEGYNPDGLIVVYDNGGKLYYLPTTVDGNTMKAKISASLLADRLCIYYSSTGLTKADDVYTISKGLFEDYHLLDFVPNFYYSYQVNQNSQASAQLKLLCKAMYYYGHCTRVYSTDII